jgi:hypothetical protein
MPEFVVPMNSEQERATGKANLLSKRLLLYLTFISILAVLYILMSHVVSVGDNGNRWPFLASWWASFVPYFAICIWVYKTKPLEGRNFWLEMILILGGALLFRSIPHPSSGRSTFMVFMEQSLLAGLYY